MTGTDETGLDPADMERIAAACNSAIWFLQRGSGEQLAPTPWLKDAPAWAVESTEDSVRAVWAGVTMEQLWQRWAAAKRADDWVYGPVKDPAKKTHPCLVGDYSELPAREQHKDRVFVGVIELEMVRRVRKDGSLRVGSMARAVRLVEVAAAAGYTFGRQQTAMGVVVTDLDE